MSLNPRLQSDLLAHKECASLVGKEYRNDFFICTKTSKPNYTICQYCMENCHEYHDCCNLLPNAKYECICANDHHKPTIDLVISTGKTCVYQELYKNTENSGFYEYNNKSFCGICVTTCMSKLIDMKKKVTEKQKQYCECDQHSGINAILALTYITASFSYPDAFYTYSLRDHYYHFDFNIFGKNEYTNGPIIQKLHDYLNSKENLSVILQDFTFQIILESFTKLSLQCDNKGFYYDNMNFDIFDNSMKFIDEVYCEQLDEYETMRKYNHLKTQFYLLYLLFSIYVRGSFIKTHNLWSTEAIYQMNGNQRLKYIQNIDTVHDKVLRSHDNNNSDEQKRTNKIINYIIERYEDFLNQSENSGDYMFTMYFDIYPYFSSMMKFVFKYNIMKDHITTSSKYFLLVNETLILKEKHKKRMTKLDQYQTCINLGNERNVNNFLEKTILYFLLYENDRSVMNIILSHQKRNTKISNIIYTAEDNENIQKIKKIISGIYFEKLIKPDTKYIKMTSLPQYIFQNFIKKESLLQLSVYNLQDLPKISLNNNKANITPRTYTSIIKETSEKMRNDSRDFMIYKITLDNYIQLIEQSLEKFNNYIQDKQDFILDLNADYLSMLNIYKDDKTKKTLEEFQYDIKQSMLFQGLYEVIGIFSLRDKLKYKINEEIPMISNKARKFILQLYYLIMINNPECICLVLNQDKQSFTSFFNHINEDFFCFYQRVIEILSIVNYQFPDIISLIKPLFMIKGIANENYTESPQLFYQCTNKFFKICNIIFHTLASKYYDSMTEIGVELFNKIQTISTILKDSINTYLEEEMKILNEQKVSHKAISDCISNYFKVIAQFECLEISKYVTYHDIGTSAIFEVNTIPALFKKYIKTSSNERTIDISVIISMLYFYLLKTCPFRINIANANDLLKNMLSECTIEDDEKKLSNLSFINICRSDKATNKQSDQINIQLQELFDKLDFISLIAMNYEELFKAVFNSRNSFDSMEELKIASYCFIQDVLLKPSYQLLQSLEIYLPYVKGIMLEHVRQMVFYLLKAFEFFYLNITVLTKEEINYVSEEDRSVNELEIQKELTQEQLKLLHKSIEENATMKYFQFNAFIKNYNVNISNIYNNNIQKKSFEMSEESNSLYQQLLNQQDNFILFWDLNFNYDAALFFPSKFNIDQTGFKCVQNFSTLLSVILDGRLKEEKNTISEKIEKIMTDSKIMYYIKYMFFYCLNQMISRINLTTKRDNSLNNSSHHYQIIYLFIMLFDFEKIKEKFFNIIYDINQQDNESSNSDSDSDNDDNNNVPVI